MDRMPWNADRLNQVIRGYQASCVLAAAAELNLFAALAQGELLAGEVAERLQTDPRGIRTLLDALVALDLLDRQGERYRVPAEVADLMVTGRPGSQLAMVQHQANCLRNWAQLAAVVKHGEPAPRAPSIRGAEADYASFIEAMDNVASITAAGLIAALQPLSFTHLLDVGGASGTYTIAFLRAKPKARATLFDLPQVMPQARERLNAVGLLQRVTLVPGDYNVDPLPVGADLAWVSAIVHQNSREQNQALFRRVYEALVAGGRIMVRDFIMVPTRTRPVGGTLFAINMLVGTSAGGTFTFDELREDLSSAGFVDITILVPSDTMNSVLTARKA